MRVMLIFKGDPQPGAAPSEELLGAIGRYNDELKEAGVLIDLAAPSAGASADPIRGLLPGPAGRPRSARVPGRLPATYQPGHRGYQSLQHCGVRRLGTRRRRTVLRRTRAPAHDPQDRHCPGNGAVIARTPDFTGNDDASHRAR